MTAPFPPATPPLPRGNSSSEHHPDTGVLVSRKPSGSERFFSPPPGRVVRPSPPSSPGNRWFDPARGVAGKGGKTRVAKRSGCEAVTANWGGGRREEGTGDPEALPSPAASGTVSGPVTASRRARPFSRRAEPWGPPAGGGGCHSV